MLPTRVSPPQKVAVLVARFTSPLTIHGRLTVGDGKAKCFSSEAETGIPALQEYCSSLPIPSRQRAVQDWLLRIRTFALSVHTALVQGAEGFAADRTQLRERWESQKPIRGMYHGYLNRRLLEHDTSPAQSRASSVESQLKTVCISVIDAQTQTVAEIYAGVSEYREGSYTNPLRRTQRWTRRKVPRWCNRCKGLFIVR